MYHADSDLLTIVLYLLAMAAGLYSSFKKESKQDKAAKRNRHDRAANAAAQETLPNVPQEPSDNRVVEDDDLFSFALDKIFVETEDTALESVGNAAAGNMAAESASMENMSMEDEPAESVSVEEGYEAVENSSERKMSVEPVEEPVEIPAVDPVGIPVMEIDEEPVPEPDDLKKMLKRSPKNIILASEILNPKYKEY